MYVVNLISLLQVKKRNNTFELEKQTHTLTIVVNNVCKNNIYLLIITKLKLHHKIILRA